jgi:hypothetical protein
MLPPSFEAPISSRQLPAPSANLARLPFLSQSSPLPQPEPAYPPLVALETGSQCRPAPNSNPLLSIPNLNHVYVRTSRHVRPRLLVVHPKTRPRRARALPLLYPSLRSSLERLHPSLKRPSTRMRSKRRQEERSELGRRRRKSRMNRR